MLKKVSRYLVLLIFVLIYLASSSAQLTKELTSIKLNTSSFFKSDRYRYGDMFGLSFLPGFQIETSKNSIVPIKKYKVNANIDLYAICDSYIWEYANQKKYYCGADSFIMVTTNNHSQLKAGLNLKRDNILLLEFSERNVRPLLNNTSYTKDLIVKTDDGKTSNTKTSQNIPFKQKIREFIFNPAINENLKSNVWDYSWFTPIKELRAQINYKLLNYIEEGVALSPDGKQLFFAPTVDTLNYACSFNYLPDKELNFIVDNLNSVYDRAKTAGFKEVYLTIVPNPVTILYPNLRGFKYNQLIPRIQNSPKLKMPCVDLYSDFKTSDINFYQQSDSHWNYNGLNLFLNKFNKIIADRYAKLP